MLPQANPVFLQGAIAVCIDLNARGFLVLAQ